MITAGFILKSAELGLALGVGVMSLLAVVILGAIAIAYVVGRWLI